MLPWLLLGGFALLALGKRPVGATSAPVTLAATPTAVSEIAPGVGGAPGGGVAGMLEPDDGVRGNFGAAPPYRPTVAEQVAALPRGTYNVFNAGEMATRPGVPDAVERSLRSSPLGLSRGLL